MKLVSTEYDIAILVAADSDFCPAVEAVKGKGQVVANAYFSLRRSFHLQEACNGPLICLDKLDFLYRPEDTATLVRPTDIRLPPKKR